MIKITLYLWRLHRHYSFRN